MFYNRKTNKIWPIHILVRGRHLGSRSGTFSVFVPEKQAEDMSHTIKLELRLCGERRILTTSMHLPSTHTKHAHERVSRMVCEPERAPIKFDWWSSHHAQNKGIFIRLGKLNTAGRSASEPIADTKDPTFKTTSC